jgi:lantibiotic modifying enzyme
VYTGIAHGAAGAGMFFVHLYEHSGRAEDLQVAIDAYRWMRQHTVPLASGIGWKRLTSDTSAYHGFCGGSSGILYLIEELHRATGDAAYLQDLIATADGLAASPRKPAAGQAAWPYTSVSTSSAPVIYCHGTSCATAALAHAWTLTGDAKYQNVARDGAARLGVIATTTAADGPVWPHIENTRLIETGFQTGAASVGYTFLRLHAALGEQQYLARAITVGDYLLRVADRPATGQMRWINYLETLPGSTDVPAYETGWYKGAAGIGLFLLDLHERVNARPALNRFSPIHP